MIYAYLEIVGVELDATGEVYAELMVCIVKCKNLNSYQTFLENLRTENDGEGEPLKLHDNANILKPDGSFNFDDIDEQKGTFLRPIYHDLGPLGWGDLELETEQEEEVFNKIVFLKNRGKFINFANTISEQSHVTQLFSNSARYFLRVIDQ